MSPVHRFIHEWVWVLLVLFCIIGLFYPAAGLAALICMLAPSVTAFFAGRLWCGRFCPRGSFNDNILVRWSRKNRLPSWVQQPWFRTGFLILLMGAFLAQLIFAWGNIATVGAVFVRMILATTLITIVLGLLYKPRTWCVICPMGTMANWVTRLVRRKVPKISFEKGKCITCGACQKVCPVEIPVQTFKENGVVLHDDCLKCHQCIKRCPKKAISLSYFIKRGKEVQL